ncbi:Rec8 like protein-domain-containing protein [Lactarius quietus]|nr:Rec8 like protein-domain-containing protein [Lactarius quietus]
MFFTSELLSRRDSGFGLLWLAATLGARSSFKKLPKRDVMGADIIQLCGLITEPAEPLALRLSSNLMVGVARVYKVKHDIFLGDVNACFASLKKAVRDLHALSAASAHLQMGQPFVRADAVTVRLDPAIALGLNLDDFLGDWQDILEAQVEADSDDEYGRPRKKAKSRDKQPLPHPETGRATMHTLEENLEQIMSGSFDASFLGGASGEQELFSSSMDDGFGFGDCDDFGLGDIGDELAKELGEGWASSAVQPRSVLYSKLANGQIGHVGLTDILSRRNGHSMYTLIRPMWTWTLCRRITWRLLSRCRPLERTTYRDLDRLPPVFPGLRSPVALTPTPPWVTSGDVAGLETAAPVELIAEKPISDDEAEPVPKKIKRVRLQLDVRTELTDAELKTARARYVEGQEAIRRSIEDKKLEKEGAHLISQMLFGVPQILKAPSLVDFWTDNFKVLVEARSGGLHIKTTGELPARYRPVSEPPGKTLEEFPEPDQVYEADVGMIDDLGRTCGVVLTIRADETDGQEPRVFDEAHQRSSEEPGQARHASIGSFPAGSAFELGRNVEVKTDSQKSSLFPWDNAGLSSSAAGAPFDIGSDRISIGHDELRLKDTSAGRNSGRESSLVPSQNSGPVTFGFSPGTFGKTGSQINDSFEFDVPADSPLRRNAPGAEPDLITLERNSYNFLEYVKMQLQTVHRPHEGLAFNNIAPRETSTRHVASAAFYHCLVLATKGVLRVNQLGAYGEIMIKLT